MAHRIFISYSWKNKDIADIIDNDWKAVGINLVRDVRDLEYKQNIKDFMRQVRSTDYVLLLMSKGYLESKNCMYEALEMFEDASFKKKILPILMEDAKIFDPLERLAYIDYWQTKADDLNKATKKLKNMANAQSIYQELNHYNKIRDTVDRFIDEFNNILCVNWPKEKEDNYKNIFKEVGIKDDYVAEECIRILNIPDKEEQELAFEQLIVKHPNNSNVSFFSGYLAQEHKKFKKAKEYYEQAISFNPGYAITYNNLALLLADHFSQYEQAKEHFEQAIALDPNDATAYNNVAVLLKNYFSQYEQAKKYFEQAIAVNPKYAITYNNLALLLANHFSQYEQAKEYYEQAIALDPKYATAYNNLASLLEDHFSQYEQAKGYYEQAIAIDPKYTDAYNNLALLLEKHFSQYEQARGYYEQAIAINPSHATAYYNLAGLLFTHFEQNELAREYYQQAIALNPNLELE